MTILNSSFLLIFFLLKKMSFFFYNFIYLFLAVLGHHCYEQGLLSCHRARALEHAGFSSCGMWAQ